MHGIEKLKRSCRENFKKECDICPLGKYILSEFYSIGDDFAICTLCLDKTDFCDHSFVITGELYEGYNRTVNKCWQCGYIYKNK